MNKCFVILATMFLLCRVLAAQAGEIHAAAGKGDVKKVEALIAADPAQSNARDENDETPLHWAVYFGQKEATAVLLAHGAQLDIFAASGLGRLADVKAFVEKDPALVKAKMKLGVTALHWAAVAAQKNVAEYLIEHGADVNATESHDNTPLHLAAKMDQAQMVEFLISRGAAANARKNTRETPLLVAAGKGSRKAIRALLANGADVNAVERSKQTALHYATLNADVEMVRILLAHGANPRAADDQGMTPLQIAEKQKLPEIFALLNGAK